MMSSTFNHKTIQNIDKNKDTAKTIAKKLKHFAMAQPLSGKIFCPQTKVSRSK